ncbi:hypothetical protein EOM82_07215, partial [bacterium]|nr:hypothetical protein [bacterium]
MYNKKTAIFFTDTYKNSVANVLKSEFVKKNDRVGIIVAKKEVESLVANNLIDRIIPADTSFRYKIKNLTLPLINKNSDKVVKKSIPFMNVNNGKEKRIANVLSRYNPEVVVVTDHSLLHSCISAVNSQGNGAKVVVAYDEFTLDKRIVNKNVDLYFVDNMEIKQALIAEGIAEEKIEITDLPIENKFFATIEYGAAAKKLNIDTSKKTLLFCASYIGDERFFKLIDAVSEARFDANIVFACGKNRKFLAMAREKNFIAFNESLDMNFALTAADLVIMRPTTILMQEAISKNKKVFSIFPIDKIEENNQNYLAVDKIAKYSDIPSLIAAIRNFLDDTAEREAEVIEKITIDEEKEDSGYEKVIEAVSFS